ncbi:MAG: FAD-dependent oxidoreductase [Rhodospirillaceae bacterium]|nr:FAD-dependent oxidoreductase [Rhodospirillaceae bacterium]
MTETLPTQAQAVIIGGGVVGCSIAYHLTKLGWTDIVLLERMQLTSGTTWHAAGLIGQLRGSPNMTALAKYTAELYLGLEEETGQATGFRQTGSLYIASDDERMEELKRMASMAKVFDLRVDVIDPSEIKAHYPPMDVDDLVGGLFVPSDGQASPVDVSMALAKGARMAGAKVIEGVKVTDILRQDGRVAGVVTDQGDIQANVVVNAAGMWAREVGLMAGVAVPLHACEHFYVVTEKIPGLPDDLPVMREQDACAYYKGEAGALLVGAFEPNAKPWGMDGIPEDFCFDELPEDLEHFMPVLEGAMKRVPLLQETGIRKFFCGPESFTPDDRYHLGEAPELPGFYVAAGLNSIGIQSAGGIGKVLASWIVDGHAPFDLWEVDIRRNELFQNNARYLKERVSETLGLLYDNHFPYRQYATSRGVRTTPFWDQWRDLGACFGEGAGWERPNWFAPKGMAPAYEYSFKRQNWFEHSAAEHQATREGVALYDLSGFTKFLVQGPDAEAALQRISAGDMAVEEGRLVYTQWLNERAGIEADLTVMRLGETVFQVTGGSTTRTRDWNWLTRNIAEDRCVATDQTPGIAVLGVMGPKSRELLQRLTPADLSNEAFPFATSREIEFGFGYVRAARVSFVGELGWELHVTADMARHVLASVLEAGADLGVVPAGMHAMESCRLEKAFRHWGHDISDEDSPIQGGLMFACKPDKGLDFIGRDALLRLRDAGAPKRRLVQFKLLDAEPMLYHNEPIFRDGQVVGRLTSAGYGHTLGASIGLGYIAGEGGVTANFIKAGSYEIEVAGERFEADASLRAMYDPTGERMRG